MTSLVAPIEAPFTRRATAQPDVVFKTTDTLSLAVEDQMPFWREQVGHVVDADTSRSQIIHGFRAKIVRYSVDDLLLTEAVGDPVRLTRSVSRVSVDRSRGYSFYLTLAGALGEVKGGMTKRSAPPVRQGLLALDMDEPFAFERSAHRVLSFVVPKAMMAGLVTDIEVLHTQVVDSASPLAGLAFEHMTGLMQDMPRLSGEGAAEALRVGLKLLVASFNMDWRRNAAAREAAHLAIIHKVYRYIDLHIDDAGLNAVSLSALFGIPLASLQRWFTIEGGVDGYILYKRLRAAADQLIDFPLRTIEEIAFGLAFKSVQDFTDAFLRAFNIAPADGRAQGLALKARAVFDGQQQTPSVIRVA